MKPVLLAALTAGALLAGSAFADDSTAELAAGGLVLTQNADIRMASEDLAISPNAVKVRYEFANDSAKDIDAIVAFPLPDLNLGNEVGQSFGSIKTYNIANFVGFTLTVDGKPVAATAEQHAMLNGRDVTAQVKAAGFSLFFGSPADIARLKAMSAAQRKALEDAGLIMDVSGEGFDPNQVFAQWTLTTKFWWRQHFPAGKTVVVQHDYQPVTGDALLPTFDTSPKGLWADDLKNYCIDASTAKAIAAIAKVKTTTLEADRTDFVLKTANNWKGPIGHFHLTLDKLKPGNVLTLCWPSALTKTGATTFESTLTNYAPKSDIQMMVIW
jgi:hypothetical protein